MDLKLRDGESVIRKGGASHRRGLETVGGRLYLTNQRLIFSPHSINIQIGRTEYVVAGIKEVTITGYLGTELVVRWTRREERFIVFRPRSWRQAIQGALSSTRPGSNQWGPGSNQ